MMIIQDAKQTCAFSADTPNSARLTVSAAGIRRNVDTVLCLRVKSDDGCCIHRAIHRVVDSTAGPRRRSNDHVVVMAGPGVMDLVAADHTV